MTGGELSERDMQEYAVIVTALNAGKISGQDAVRACVAVTGKIVAARVAAVEAEVAAADDERLCSCGYATVCGECMAAARGRAEAAEAEVARLTAEVEHYREFFAPDVEALAAAWQATVDQTVDEANRQLAEKDTENARLSALVEAGLALADEWECSDHRTWVSTLGDQLRAVLGGTE